MAHKRHLFQNHFIPGGILLLGSLATLIFRFYFPYHRALAITLLIMAVTVASIPSFSFFRELPLYKVAWAAIIMSLAVAIYIMAILFPLRAIVPVDGGLEERILKDAQALPEFLSSIDHDPFLTSPYLSMSLANSSQEDIIALKEGYALFLDRMLLLDFIIADYEGFYKIRRMVSPELHGQAFLNGYSAYLARYGAVLKLQEAVQRNDYVKGILDSDMGEFGRSNYASLRHALFNPETMIRANAGRAYLDRVGTDGPLWQYSSQAFDRLFGSSSSPFLQGWKSLLISFEEGTMSGWLPVQEKIAYKLARTRTTTRDGFLISPEQAEEVRSDLLPGDIFLTRRNWLLSNAGMPGFWTHSGIYTGSLEELDEYFREESLARFNASFSSVLLERHPDVYYLKSEDPFLQVIEGRSEGIIMLPFALSADADHLAILRPNLSAAMKMDALLFAFDKHGAPYDFNFDFSSEDAYVCSELVYKAYKGGLNFSLERTAGRWILAPNDMAKQASVSEPGVDFVSFLDGDEEKGYAVEKGAEDFFASWKRPKHDLVLKYG